MKYVNGVIFSTDVDESKSKTKVLLTRGTNRKGSPPAPMQLYGRNLPYVSKINHLGHLIDDRNTFNDDIKQKKAILINKLYETRDLFKHLHPREQMTAAKIFCNFTYGSNLWELQSDEVRKYWNCWTVGAKDTWGLHRGTHTYLVDTLLLEQSNLRDDILSNYRGFYSSLLRCPSLEVSTIAALLRTDVRSRSGRNLAYLHDICGFDPLSKSKDQVRTKIMERRNLTEDKVWIANQLADLIGYRIELRDFRETLSEEEEADLNHIDESITSLCIS